jgi:hypothetical protein
MVSTLTVRRQWPDQLVLAVLVAFVPDSYISLNVHAGVLSLAGTLIGIAVLERILAKFHCFIATGDQARDSFS